MLSTPTNPVPVRHGLCERSRPANEIREELLSAIDELGRLRPDWRLGQLLANLAVTAGRMDPGGLWTLEDEAAIEAARVLIEESQSQSHVSTEVVG